MKHGDFTQLAAKYALYRPGYAPSVIKALRAMAAGNMLADIGSGTGICARQLAEMGFRVIAIEPNAAMRREGMRLSEGYNIAWVAGKAEATGVADKLFDVVSIASALHWTNFDAAVREIYRILKPGGLFIALWNTRLLEENAMLMEIEKYLHSLVPEINRISSGNSEFCASLTKKLLARKEFSDVLYMEGRHTEMQSPERYIGLWESVNDVRVQAGEERFNLFLSHVKSLIQGVPSINAEYLTRAWLARRAE